MSLNTLVNTSSLVEEESLDNTLVKTSSNTEEEMSDNSFFNVSPSSTRDSSGEEFINIEDVVKLDDMNLPIINEDDKLPDIVLKSVKEIQSVLGNLPYETIRKVLYKKYGLVVKDDNDIKDLYMITYNKKEKYKNNIDLPEDCQKLLDEYRGVILEKDTNKLLCYTFNRMHRKLPDEWDLKNCKVTRTYDGSQIKIFYHKKNNVWIISTTRKINSGTAYFFSSKSFSEMFADASHSLNWTKLNKKCCYSFVLAHPDNRIIEIHNKPYITHVLTRNMETFDIVDENISVSKPQVFTFPSKKDLFAKIKKLPMHKEGFVVQHNDDFIKVVNLKYQKIKELRGYSGSLIFQYFKLKKEGNITKYLSYYPEMKDSFNQFNSCFENLCRLVFSEYVNLRVRKIITLDNVLIFLKPVLYRVHGIHLKSKKRIKLKDVKDHLNEYHPNQLRKLIEMAYKLSYFDMK